MDIFKVVFRWLSWRMGTFTGPGVEITGRGWLDWSLETTKSFIFWNRRLQFLARSWGLFFTAQNINS